MLNAVFEGVCASLLLFEERASMKCEVSIQIITIKFISGYITSL